MLCVVQSLIIYCFYRTPQKLILINNLWEPKKVLLHFRHTTTTLDSTSAHLRRSKPAHSDNTQQMNDFLMRRNDKLLGKILDICVVCGGASLFQFRMATTTWQRRIKLSGDIARNLPQYHWRHNFFNIYFVIIFHSALFEDSAAIFTLSIAILLLLLRPLGLRFLG